MKFSSMFKRGSRGFTLIELLVVIAIIGILSTVVLSTLNSARIKSRDSNRLLQIKQFKTALELFYADNGYYPDCGDIGYAGGCDYSGFNGPGSNADTSRDGQFMRFLQPYLKGNIQDPINSSTNFYIYVTNAVYPAGSGNTYQYMIGVFLEDPTNPAIRTNIAYGDPTGPLGTYILIP